MIAGAKIDALFELASLEPSFFGFFWFFIVKLLKSSNKEFIKFWFQGFRYFFRYFVSDMSRKVILIGYMGSGKTTLGKKLARELKVPFIDSDEQITAKFSKTIPQIFSEEGEKAFRRKESDFIETLMSESEFVLSTGGGLPCFNSNMEVLNRLGCTIYLKNTSEALAERLMISKNERPLIQGMSKEKMMLFIDENIEKREVYYNQARIILNPEEQSILNVYQRIRDIL